MIPDPGDPFSYNRFLYAGGNPLKYNDPSGHCIFGIDTAVCIAVAIVASKVIDWGWTGYDMYQYSQVLLDANSSPEAIAQAKTDMYTAFVAEAIEPDEATFGIPLDDIVRHWDDIAPILAATLKSEGTEKLLWTSWREYPKVVENGREYAQIGNRLYTRHAVDYLQPSGLGTPAGATNIGRSISPTFVEEAILNGQATTVMVDGVERTKHVWGDIQVITEDAGRIVVTVNPFTGR
jgi:hypothetical protein